MNERIREGRTDPRHRAERGYALAGQSEWNEAAADFSEAIRSGIEDPAVWFQSAVVALTRRREGEYADVCAQMVDRFADTWMCAPPILSPGLVRWRRSHAKLQPPSETGRTRPGPR